MVNKNMALTNDEHSMIFSNHFGIHFAPKGQGSTPSNDYNQILTCAVQISSAFLFTVAACILPAPFNILCWACLACILICRVITVVLFLLAVVKNKYLHEFYRSSLFFWGWWPMWLLVTVSGATAVGFLTGSYLWNDCLGPYFELKKLQKYKDINPEHIPGSRLQDAGLVDFTNFVEMDRSKGGCYMNQGNTYCLAPIVNGGEVKYGMQGTPRTGSFDYFAVGINCCSCPNRDFQCGDWRNPIASGGIRSLDARARPFYQLALDDWQASYQKSSKSPLFFEWVQDAEWAWKGMWNRALNVGVMAASCGVAVAISLAFMLDKILQMLWHKDIVAPRACFAPAYGTDALAQVFLPKMYYRQQQEQQEIASMPVKAEWKAERGPGTNAEDGVIGGQGYGAAGMLGSAMFDAAMAPPGADFRSSPVANYGVGY